MNSKIELEGVLFGTLSYLLWGIIPIYWKFLDYMDSTVILAHRVVWSCVFMIFILMISKKCL